MKICSKCREYKPLDAFHKQAAKKDGRRSRCRECHNSDCAAWAKQNPEKRSTMVKLWIENNPERHAENMRKWTEKNKEKISARSREWSKDNRERQTENVLRWRQNNLERSREIDLIAARKRRQALSPQERIVDRIHHSIATLLRRGIRNGKSGLRTFEILGYSVGDLMNHLGAQFTEGMSWDNYGEWHIDHKRPRVSFDISSIEDSSLKACWGLNNLQPLWAADNHSKGSKWTKH